MFVRVFGLQTGSEDVGRLVRVGRWDRDEMQYLSSGCADIQIAVWQEVRNGTRTGSRDSPQASTQVM